MTSLRTGSTTYRAVLVENERHSLSRLRRLLASLPDVEIVGEAEDGPSAVTAIRELLPDLVFLDIDLPGFDGFQVLDQLDQQPAVIFTTAFTQHALEAFKTYAVAYLLKPIDSDALEGALVKLRAMGFRRSQLSGVLQQPTHSPESDHSQRIACKAGDTTILLKVGEVLYFETDDQYTSVRTASREFLIDTPLTELERQLGQKDFIRIHRSILVNVSWIADIRRSYGGSMKVVLNDTKATELVASRMYADKLRAL